MARQAKFTKDELFQATKDLLLQNGYAGFHFGLLAERLNVTRTALYKYFMNKDELITEFMELEMDQFMMELKKIEEYADFQDQLSYLLDIIYKNSKLHQTFSLAYQIPTSSHHKVNKALERLEKQHKKMYFYLNEFAELGKRKKILKKEFPNHFILGSIFQMVNVPNHGNLPAEEWKRLMTDFICHGMFTRE